MTFVINWILSGVAFVLLVNNVVIFKFKIIKYLDEHYKTGHSI